MVRSSWNLKKRFETWVATIWMVEIRFWARELVLLSVNSNIVFFMLSLIFFCFSCQERLYNPILYVLLMYLIASKYYFREDRCNSLLFIVKVWTVLSLMVFPLIQERFIFLLHEFITTSYYCLFNFAQENDRKILIFIEILWFHPNNSKDRSC